MGVFHPKTFLPFFLLLLLIPPAFTDDKINSLPDDNTSSSPSLPPPPLSLPEYSPFKPTIAIIVGVLTTMFSIIFLLLLYARHCKRNHSLPNSRGLAPAPRKNSGIHRAVIESLPIFRFGSLRGEKDGLECAVCLNKFESAEVLRLLPKCKHAFHVECVDTWLDAHSTCPLCRYRVDPEDILLIGDTHVLHENEQIPPHSDPVPDPAPKSSTQRVSGRHSSAGEKATALLQKPGDPDGEPGRSRNPASHRRSLDSSTSTNKNETVINIACFDRPRKDGLLLTDGERKSTPSDRKLEHRIIVSGGTSTLQQRWSDVQPSDLLHLRSEMIINESERRMSTWTSARKQEQRKRGRIEEGGRRVIKTRSVSEIMGLSRFSFSSSGHHHHRHRERDGVLPRWSDVGSGRTAIGSS